MHIRGYRCRKAASVRPNRCRLDCTELDQQQPRRTTIQAYASGEHVARLALPGPRLTQTAGDRWQSAGLRQFLRHWGSRPQSARSDTAMPRSSSSDAAAKAADSTSAFLDADAFCVRSRLTAALQAAL